MNMRFQKRPIRDVVDSDRQRGRQRGRGGVVAVYIKTDRQRPHRLAETRVSRVPPSTTSLAHLGGQYRPAQGTSTKPQRSAMFLDYDPDFPAIESQAALAEWFEGERTLLAGQREEQPF